MRGCPLASGGPVWVMVWVEIPHPYQKMKQIQAIETHLGRTPSPPLLPVPTKSTSLPPAFLCARLVARIAWDGVHLLGAPEATLMRRGPMWLSGSFRTLGRRCSPPQKRLI